MLWSSIYRSTKKENCYLYIEHEGDFSKVPESILSIFGMPVFAMKVLIDSKRRFVAASAEEIENRIKKDGFFLQMLKDDDFKV